MAYFKKTSNLSNSAEVVIHRDSSSMSTLRSLWISYGLRDLVFDHHLETVFERLTRSTSKRKKTK